MKNTYIAILGWGSTLWDEKKYREFDLQRNEWQFDGPLLPLEFCRKARDRGNALTLVIDSKHGSLCQVSWCFSKRQNLEDAIEDLRLREGTNKRTISYIHSAQTDARQEPEATIKQWALKKQIDVVIWSGFGCNFRDFTAEGAIRHLERLPETSRRKAIDYIYKASPFIQTRLREMLTQCSWFSMECKNLKLSSRTDFDLIAKREEETFTHIRENAHPAFCLAASLLELYETFLQCLTPSSLLQPDYEFVSSLQHHLNKMKANATTACMLIMRGHIAESEIFNKRSLQLCAVAKYESENRNSSAVFQTYLQFAQTNQWSHSSFDELAKAVLSHELFREYTDICLSEKVALLADCSNTVKLTEHEDTSTLSAYDELPISLIHRLLQTIHVHFRMLELLGETFSTLAHFERWFADFFLFREELRRVRALYQANSFSSSTHKSCESVVVSSSRIT